MTFQSTHDEEIPLWYTHTDDSTAEEEAVEAQLIIEWFEQDKCASREFIERAMGKDVYLPFPSFCLLSNIIVNI